MGWKAIRDHYRIAHGVQVTSDGICIGSPYIHDIMVIRDGVLVKTWNGGNSDLKRYREEMEADPAKLTELASCEDTFERSQTVYTYDGGTILEKQCEVIGWPNVTHDGLMQFENTFSADRAQVVAWAISNAEAGIEWGQKSIAEAEKALADAQRYLAQRTENLQRLQQELPA